MKKLQAYYAKPDATKDLFGTLDELLENI